MKKYLVFLSMSLLLIMSGCEKEKEAVIETKTEHEKITIHYSTQRVEDDSIEIGKEVITQEGADGIKTNTYEVTYTDGKESSRELSNEEFTKEPINMIISVGTKKIEAPKETVDNTQAPQASTPPPPKEDTSTSQNYVQPSPTQDTPSAQNNVQSSPGQSTTSGQENSVSEFYKNCTELRKVYPKGVPSDHPAYRPPLDRDKDNWACEA